MTGDNKTTTTIAVPESTVLSIPQAPSFKLPKLTVQSEAGETHPRPGAIPLFSENALEKLAKLGFTGTYRFSELSGTGGDTTHGKLVRYLHGIDVACELDDLVSELTDYMEHDPSLSKNGNYQTLAYTLPYLDGTTIADMIEDEHNPGWATPNIQSKNKFIFKKDSNEIIYFPTGGARPSYYQRRGFTQTEEQKSAEFFIVINRFYSLIAFCIANKMQSPDFQWPDTLSLSLRLCGSGHWVSGVAKLHLTDEMKAALDDIAVSLSPYKDIFTKIDPGQPLETICFSGPTRSVKEISIEPIKKLLLASDPAMRNTDKVIEFSNTVLDKFQTDLMREKLTLSDGDIFTPLHTEIENLETLIRLSRARDNNNIPNTLTALSDYIDAQLLISRQTNSIQKTEALENIAGQCRITVEFGNKAISEADATEIEALRASKIASNMLCAELRRLPENLDPKKPNKQLSDELEKNEAIRKELDDKHKKQLDIRKQQRDIFINPALNKLIQLSINSLADQIQLIESKEKSPVSSAMDALKSTLKSFKLFNDLIEPNKKRSGLLPILSSENNPHEKITYAAMDSLGSTVPDSLVHPEIVSEAVTALTQNSNTCGEHSCL
ncbi:MAG: hypothetical protein V4490_01155, partial [Pseudomonadota bacterium]